MDATQVAVLPHAGPATGRRSFVIISLAALIATAFFVGVALPYLILDPKVLARYWVAGRVGAGAHQRRRRGAPDGTRAVMAWCHQACGADSPAPRSRLRDERRHQLRRRVLPVCAYKSRVGIRSRHHRLGHCLGGDDHAGSRCDLPRLRGATPRMDDSQLRRDVRVRHIPGTVDRTSRRPVSARCTSSLPYRAGSAGPCRCSLSRPYCKDGRWAGASVLRNCLPPQPESSKIGRVERRKEARPRRRETFT